MIYDIEFKPRAIRDLESLSQEVALRIIRKIEAMKNDLSGDVKRLTQHSAEY